ncbi:sulfatase [Humisphaera borealis]|uniref:Sulfatase n=1 Tax=Humisphaera borealis TaxID=2807512 RepID=A0A7M2X550_9BACT|nr:sulfatase [Humisphaera borealis]QOV92171.1 sulfatase [Humisphaera borealis]
MRSTIGFAVALLLFFAPAAQAQTPAKPNVIVFLIDDMGWRDVGCYGSKYYETPAIDKLASQGMRFTQAYAACCVCSPTRAALLTGKSPARLGITDWIPGQRPKGKPLNGADIHNELALSEVTIAEALKADGYVTASIGKWHLGGPEFYPEKNGFDVNIAGTHKGQPPSYFAPYKIDTLPEGPKGEYLTDRLTTEAETFIDTNKDKPFFLYFPHFSVHTPIQAKKDLEGKYAAKTTVDGQNNPAYAAMVDSTDQSVGRVMKKLDDLKLAEKTIVIFTSDNGGLSMRNAKGLGPTNNEPLRGGKGSPWEGGTRVPLIVRWTGVIKPGVTDATPVISYDFFNTLLDLTGSKSPKAASGDGESFAAVLKQSGKLARDTIYWHYPHYHPGGATPNSSLRQGDWKLVRFYEDGHRELYNLKDDPYEKNDLAKANPEQTAKLDAVLSAYLKETGAKMPTANPQFDPKAAQGQ